MIGAWLRRFFNREHDATAPYAAEDPPGEPTDEIVQEMREYVRREVWGGYSDREGAIEFGVEMFIDQADAALLRPISEKLVDEALADHAHEAARWPEITDCDRLDSAFETLEHVGIVCRQNFSCCGTCGTAEIWDEIGVEDAISGSKRGYAFFHQQDTERGVDGEGIYLNYGACAEGEAAAVAIGHEIVDHLERAGLRTDWDGDLGRRIGVSLDWKRRRPN